jgi:hypothetical protein
VNLKHEPRGRSTQSALVSHSSPPRSQLEGRAGTSQTSVETRCGRVEQIARAMVAMAKHHPAASATYHYPEMLALIAAGRIATGSASRERPH